jgi:tRNA dimethylallyltransferase
MSKGLSTVLILGPTAGGKTRVAIDLALRLPEGGECICCDSMQVYRGMDIGTAKPTATEQAEVPHHLLDVVDPSDDCFSVDRWLELAEAAITDIQSRGRRPIVVGGTNLYVQAFLRGLMPGPPPALALRSRLGEMELSELRQWLERIDPAAAQRIHANDRKRTIRAIEVFEQTGRRISEQQTQWDRPRSALSDQNGEAVRSSESVSADQPIIIGLDFPVEIINRRINARVNAMMQAGFLEEVSRLHQAGKLGRNAREALGYKQLIEFLEGRATLTEAVEQIKIRTRRFAKQQRSWLRRFRGFANSAWIDAVDKTPQELANQAFDAVLELSSATTWLDKA